MRRIYASMSDADRRAFEPARIFIEGRLQERVILEWAAALGEHRRAERLAIQQAIEYAWEEIAQPWRDAWRLLLESWAMAIEGGHHSHDMYEVKIKLGKGDRSGDIVRQTVDLVRPVLEVKSRTRDIYPSAKNFSKKPRQVDDLLSISILAGHPVDPEELGIGSITESHFLIELASELEAALQRALLLASRLGYRREWQVGSPRRVYYVPSSKLPADEHEPDEFSSGIAGVVKLLYSTVDRLVMVDFPAAQNHIKNWRNSSDPIFARLWCAAARSPMTASAQEVHDVQLRADANLFWSVESSPEVSEVRAIRFAEMNSDDQLDVARRIRRGPPRSHWSRSVSREAIQEYRLFSIVREFRRIEVAGAALPEPYRSWLFEHLGAFPTLRDMVEVEGDYRPLKRARWIPPNPDMRFDSLEGPARLRALELDLGASPRGWDDEPAERASDWIRTGGNASLLIRDFEITGDAGGGFPHAWERFGSAHSPPGEVGTEAEAEAARVMTLITSLSDATVSGAISGLTFWLSSWERVIEDSSALPDLWLKLWPFAVAEANAREVPAEDPLNTEVKTGDERDPGDYDTLNTSVGRLVGVFLQMCPDVTDGLQPFSLDIKLRDIRDAIVVAPGRAGLIARYRLVEQLGYFLAADRVWTLRTLLAPLLEDSRDSLILWRALSRRWRFSNVLEVIGERMVERATDLRLGRESRSALAISVVLDALHAMNSGRDPAVSFDRVTQMIRMLDNEVRVEVAQMVQRFVRDMSAENAPQEATPEDLFDRAVKPLFELVWPQEVTLATPPLARALADLPATCSGRFSEAVHVIERYLVPFESWSLYDYGLRDSDQEEKPLMEINTESEASALLTLLDSTISGSDGVSYPMDLGNALERIREISQNLADEPSYRRLAALTRR